jgi:selenocysteine lyase/cysteine desulfurase
VELSPDPRSSVSPTDPAAPSSPPPPSSPSSLRAQYPVFAQGLAYLNAGTDGPLSAAAAAAGARELQREARAGRGGEHFEQRLQLGDRLRALYASVLGCRAQELSLTTCTSEGLAQVIGGMELGPADEILTSNEEHPGLLGALAAARELRGARVRMVPLEELAQAIDPRATRLIACSHVGWISGRLAPAELADVDVPVLLDGAQGAGAIPVDVRALGCDAYAGAGQKWLCGPDGTGMLYVRPELRERLAVARRGYANLATPAAGLDAGVRPDGRGLDAMSLSAETLACAVAAVEVLEAAGWSAVHERARALAERLVELLSERGRAVAPRADTTLVSFESPDPEAEREWLLAAGVILRNIPGTPWLRASVGGWNDEDDLDRLLTALQR